MICWVLAFRTYNGLLFTFAAERISNAWGRPLEFCVDYMFSIWTTCGCRQMCYHIKFPSICVHSKNERGGGNTFSFERMIYNPLTPVLCECCLCDNYRQHKYDIIICMLSLLPETICRIAYNTLKHVVKLIHSYSIQRIFLNLQIVFKNKKKVCNLISYITYSSIS